MNTTYLGPQGVLKKKQEYLIPCSYHFYSRPPQFVKGDMQYLYDSNGNKYTDFFAGVSVMNCGHCNLEILEETINQLRTLQHTTTIYLTEPIVNLAEELSAVTPGNLKKTFFCGTGSEANEGALLISKLYTGHNNFISLYNSLHGRTYLTMSVTGLDMWRTDPTLSSSVNFVSNPYCYRCPYKNDTGECGMECVLEVERVIKNNPDRKYAAMIAEVIQGNGGIITPPKNYFKVLKDILSKYGILLIIDEVQTGFARTGRMFAIEHYDIEPDIMTMAKALGNGVPIGAYTTNDTIGKAFTSPSASTLGGNPVSSVTGAAVLHYIKKHSLCLRAEKLGKKLKDGLLTLKEKYSIIGDVRGIGLMLGAELVNENKEPAVKETDIALEALKDKGIITGKNGEHRNVLAFQPPLVIEEEDIDNLLKTLDEVLQKI